ncbi:hypothetical protein [Methylosinus sp. LW4]|uniref:hypothetical protein n=1 Tax=Methylosinus sp. LW4 TaxID=136993 RepID=UPI00037FDECA|nr:hypothetical protein [Methylosinus sp. LW4]
MMDLDDWLAMHDKHATPHMTLGFTFYFKSQTMHVWPGRYSLDVGDRIFLGANGVGTISNLEFGYGRPKETTTIVLSGLDARYFALAESQDDEVRGRKAEIFILAFGTGVAGEEWKLAAVSLEATREMDKLTSSLNHDDGTSTITLTMQPLGSMRWRPVHGLITDIDQRARHAGDRGLERVGLVQYSRPLDFS